MESIPIDSSDIELKIDDTIAGIVDTLYCSQVEPNRAMIFLENKQTGNLIKVLDVTALADPNKSQISGRVQAGEEEQPPEFMEKEKLVFPSGESLPRCWVDADYRHSN